MNRDFWLERWDNQRIGFHQPQGQPLLAEFWPTLELAAETPVLIPLCGKTPDMVWLANRGHAVTGVEFSDRAAGDFFAEQRLHATLDYVDGFERHRAGTIEVLIGDFFALTAERIGHYGAVYDRAALIALPGCMRASYTEHLLTALRPGATILLIALDYDQQQMQGPPFAVGEREVRRLYGDACDIATLDERDMTPSDHLRQKGLTAAREHVYCIRRR